MKSLRVLRVAGALVAVGAVIDSIPLAAQTVAADAAVGEIRLSQHTKSEKDPWAYGLFINPPWAEGGRLLINFPEHMDFSPNTQSVLHWNEPQSNGRWEVAADGKSATLDVESPYTAGIFIQGEAKVVDATRIDVTMTVANLSSRPLLALKALYCFRYLELAGFPRYRGNFPCNFVVRDGKLTAVSDVATEKADTRIKGGNVAGCPDQPKSQFVTDQGGWIDPGVDVAISAVSSLDRKRHLVMAWTPGKSVLFNGSNPCAHADPYYGDIAPGTSVTAKGVIILTEEPLEKVVQELRALKVGAPDAPRDVRKVDPKPPKPPAPPKPVVIDVPTVVVDPAARKGPVAGAVCNLKVVTDASPDLSDMASYVHSATARWSTTEEKCWANLYWTHLLRRQTTPMWLHGLMVTDPVRSFNDYGFMMCSTMAAANCAIWHQMGLKFKFWDIALHTVAEVEYDGAYHMYDSALSAIYTRCDGKTLASVEEIAAEGACELSRGRKEAGHLARYHCLTATSPNGFLIGGDFARTLASEASCFTDSRLYRDNCFHWDYGHRYILNLKDGEAYTRYYRSLGDSPAFYVSNAEWEAKHPDPETFNPRLRIRGNGVWNFRPTLAQGFAKVAHSVTNLTVAAPFGLTPAQAKVAARIEYKVQSANVATGQRIEALVVRKTLEDSAEVSVSRNNGLTWQRVWQASQLGEERANVSVAQEVNRGYDLLVRVDLLATAPEGVILKSLSIDTVTQLNNHGQPRLNVGKNTVYVGTGDPTESIVFWPELQGGRAKDYIVDQKNVGNKDKHETWCGPIYPASPGPAYITFRMDAPNDITRLNYGARIFYRVPGAKLSFQHSVDAGQTWITDYLLCDEKQWFTDHIQYVDVKDLPAGTRSVLFKYEIDSPVASPESGLTVSLYAVRMEANYRVADAGFKPLEVTFQWGERQADYSLVRRSHTELVEKAPATYTINVGGSDHPEVESLRVNLQGACGPATYGYSDGHDAGGAKWTGRRVTYGRNLAQDKPYTVSQPSLPFRGAGDPDGKRLTDGVIGAPHAGGKIYELAMYFEKATDPVITVDLGAPTPCGAFRIHLSGQPSWDAFKGQCSAKVEVLTSLDGKEYGGVGFFDTNLRYKDVPANIMVPDDETATAPILDLVLPKTLNARYVQFRITSPEQTIVTEVQVLDAITYEPFDLKVALPDGGDRR